MIRVPCTLFRAGTSKGPFFLKSDLPQDARLRDQWLLALMGSPHDRQIDGIGGGDSLSSKVVLVGRSARADADIDYLLCQVHVRQAIVETTLNCGNMLSAVAPFAIAAGLVKATDPETTVRMVNDNTGVVMVATVQTPQGVVTYDGQMAIDGVPGTAAPVRLSFVDAVGAKTGRLLPTGNVVDEVNGIVVSCVDVAVPMVITSAAAMGKRGDESKATLEADSVFMAQLEALRRAAAVKMGLGDVSQSISPKICMVSPSQHQGAICSRYFTPFDCHDAHAVTGGLCLAAACLVEGSVAHQMAKPAVLAQGASEHELVIEHLSGTLWTALQLVRCGDEIAIPLATFIRTVRPLFEGHVVVPLSPP